VRYWIAAALAGQERWPEARAEIDSGLARAPADSMLLGLRELLRESRSATAPPRR
jgi:hypothetical protein